MARSISLQQAFDQMHRVFFIDDLRSGAFLKSCLNGETAPLAEPMTPIQI